MITSSQPADTSSPVFVLSLVYTHHAKITRQIFEIFVLAKPDF